MMAESYQASPGDQGNPSYTFLPHSQDGFYLESPGVIAVTIAGEVVGRITSAGFQSFLSNPGEINVKSAPYLAKGDGSTDDTAAIQAAIDAAYRTNDKTVFLPCATYRVTQLRMFPGVSLVGGGVGSPGGNFTGTVLEQPNGVNKSLIINDPTVLTATLYWHWSEIRHMQLRKVTGATDTIGCAIEVNCRGGESLNFTDLTIADFPEYGIRFNRGAVPLNLYDLHFFRNKGGGVRLTRTGSDTYQMVRLCTISGDGNGDGGEGHGTALIHLGPGGATMEVFDIDNVKAECGTAGQADVILLDNMLGSPVYVRGVSAIGVGATGNSICRIITGSVRLFLTNCKAAGYTHFINDVLGSRNIANGGVVNPCWLAYHTNANEQWEVSPTSGLMLGSGTPIKRHLSGTNTPSLGTINAGVVATFTITVTGAAAADSTYANPAGGDPGTGLIWCARVSANNTVTVRVLNPTGDNIATSDVLWRADVWKH